MENAESDVIDALLEVFGRRGLKVTRIAEITNIPYRTLQNYLAKKNRMPLGAYLAVCQAAGIPPDYPINRRFKIAHHALQNALIDVLGPALNVIDVDEDSRMIFQVGDHPAHEGQKLRRIAGYLAVMINGRYDLLSERELDDSFEEEEREQAGV